MRHYRLPDFAAHFEVSYSQQIATLCSQVANATRVWIDQVGWTVPGRESPSRMSDEYIIRIIGPV